MYKQSLTGSWQFRQANTADWLPAQVPGGVHTDLMAAGRIPDPFVADNEKRVQWVAESDWEYRCSFEVSDQLRKEEHIFLVCDGLDTLAEVILNGQILGKCNNMFRQYRWEIQSLLQIERNELVIKFSSPVRYIQQKQAERPLIGVTQAIDGGPHLRKAPCQFGWDWGPQLPPIGIWKDIRLEGYSLARFTSVCFHQQHTAQSVTLEARLEIETFGPGLLSAQVEVVDPNGKSWSNQESILFVDRVGFATITIPNPQLWWPNGYGSQTLYEVAVKLTHGNQIIDQQQYKIGFRIIELRRQPDQWGESFTFVVNGVPIFAKGSDWIPMDSFPTRITNEKLEHLIGSAAKSHQNMQRVWGGGFYEEDRFYDLCDRYGILVWQDMIFSCSIYPLDEPEFLENVRAEIFENVQRLRHHASLALWCGNNEMEWGWESWQWNRPELQDLKIAYDRFFHHTLPEWIAQADPADLHQSVGRDVKSGSAHPYWPSSPSSNTPFQDVNGQHQGDAHYWDVWHGRKPFTAYRSQYPRFMSEFGFQSLPPLETIRTYANEEDWNMTSYIMEYHQRSYSGNGLMIAQMTDSFLMPKDFTSLVYLSMVLQAEGIRYGVEHWRRHMDRVSGTLYWQLNDCWPVASWSSLDYFGRWKALHYAARRFYAPVLLSLKEDGSQVEIHLTSDLVNPWQGYLEWQLVNFDGKALQAGHEEVNLPPLRSNQIATLNFNLSDEQRREVVFIARLFQNKQLVSSALVTFAPNKHLKLSAPRISLDLSREGKLLAVEVTTQSLARFVELSLIGADVVFSDNYFDVVPGQPVVITCPMPEGWSMDKARKAIQVRSLYDSFK